MRALTKLIAVSLGICSLSLISLTLPKLAMAEESEEAAFERLVSSCIADAEAEGLPGEMMLEFCGCAADGMLVLAEGDAATLAELELISDAEPEEWPDELAEMVSGCIAQYLPNPEAESQPAE